MTGKKKKILVSLLILILCFIIVFGLNSGNSYVLMFKTYNATFSEKIDGIVCEKVESRGVTKFLFCDQSKGVFFSEKTPENLVFKSELYYFVVAGQTKIEKEANSTKVSFINDNDTLLVEYQKRNDGLLINGEEINP